MGWGGVGHVNVRVNLLRFLMLRWWWGGVGWGMLTFVWTCWGSWCYADDDDDGRPAKKSCQRVCMPGVRTWFFIARCGNGDSSTRTKTWRKPRCPNCKRCKNDGADSWACLNLFEAEIAFRLGEIHIYLKNHQIQTSEFQTFCDRWIVFSPRRNDDFLKKTVFHDLTFRSAGMYIYIYVYIYMYICIYIYVSYIVFKCCFSCFLYICVVLFSCK